MYEGLDSESSIIQNGCINETSRVLMQGTSALVPTLMERMKCISDCVRRSQW